MALLRFFPGGAALPVRFLCTPSESCTHDTAHLENDVGCEEAAQGNRRPAKENIGKGCILLGGKLWPKIRNLTGLLSSFRSGVVMENLVIE